MSIDQIDEYEQGERVRNWLKNNGSSLVTGVALGLAAIAGWNWWQAKGQNHQAEAASQYAELTDAVAAKDEEKLLVFSSALKSKFADTPYPALAALRAAEFLQSAGKTDAALEQLLAAENGVRDPAIGELVKLRIAQLLLAQGKHDEAIKHLDSVTSATFPALANELRGDIEAARGNRDAARTAYEAALASLDVAAPTRTIVEMKLTDSGGRLPDQPEI